MPRTLSRAPITRTWSGRFGPLATLTAVFALALACTATRVNGAGAGTIASAPRNGVADDAAWAADPASPGPDLPPAGRSLFDYLVTESVGGSKVYRIPFPFTALLDRVQSLVSQQDFGGGTRLVMIPMGRSLQRTAAAPDFFKYPRIVLAVTGEPVAGASNPGMLLKDRLYIGYVEKTAVLEVVSYNEAAGRFEFQLVKDYRAGAEPKVFYANRAICVSCHQNHAPIFSQPVWGESNANNRVAGLLRAHRTDFDLSAQANVDFPDDIEKATARANALVPLQAAWQKGCSDAADRSLSQRCRAAAFTAVLQYGLSGDQDFDAHSHGFRDDFLSTFGSVWQQRWPWGLRVAQSSLPDRNPFGGIASAYGGGADEQSTNLTAASEVPAELDPLNPRPAREIWRFGGEMDSRRFVAGWTRFFAKADFRALDAHLRQSQAQEAVPRSVYRARCALLRPEGGGSGFALQCPGDAAAQTAGLAGRFDDTGSGRIDWLNLGAAGTIRDLQLTGEAARRIGADHVLRAMPRARPLAPRLPDGRSLAGVEIRWTEAKASAPVTAQITIVLADDFMLVRRAVDRMLAAQPSLFDDVALARAPLMGALSAALGMPERLWCCADDSRMPPARLDPPQVSASALEHPELQPFFRACATCHFSQERFPPNFLTGDASQVERNLRQCAPRMLVRLAAWHTAGARRTKSPMPPVTALRTLDTTPERWTGSKELEGLQAYVAALVGRQGRAADPAELVKDGYESLPSCLPPGDAPR